ncbi:helix-turn-helix transcriptional regulator [Endozoicomonas sp. SM1973]|uniref:Helix-turn-helix transcriptional regulator n=1 Tax=Spartinivicinus marinus TaxID=2994442 RepID=A0A853IJK5_9GAMM|nr:helix-turn-helix transcriptional regulator [Spartinivicinus marinus]MCX4025193.1 helix-turn-helix transcriptional regulator [Spartinivicinus marinus]NYZ70194.1 helix-turn-helix transcriptional regulator [Spartinivicinus marinus]
MGNKKSELKDRIRAARKYRLHNQTELGELLGLSKSAVAAWEHGRNVPSIRIIQQLSEVLDCPFDWLVSDESEIDALWLEKVTNEHPDKVDNENLTRNRVMEDVTTISVKLTELALDSKLKQSDVKMFKALLQIIEERIEVGE